MNKGVKNDVLWKSNWKYRESFIIAIVLLIVGFIIEAFSGGRGVFIPNWPVNLYILVAFLNLLVALHILYKETKVVRWLASVPAAVSSIVIFTVLILLMGFTPQNDDQANEFLRLIGVSHATRSWSYLIISIYFLTTLGMVSLRRIWPLSKKNIGFLLNHAGLWILIASASLGTGDLLRLRMNLVENNAEWIAVDDYGRQYQMPMALTLLDFNIEQYDPKIGLFDNVTGSLVDCEGLNMFQVEVGKEIDILDYRFKIKEYLPSAEKQGNSFVAVEKFGAGPAVLVEYIYPGSDGSEQAWVSSGNFMNRPNMLKLNDIHTLYMFEPEPKKYSSDIVIADKSNSKDTVRLEVNKPIKSNGWKIYQLSYNEEMGKYSNSSIVELVSDPWLIIVYLGIFMVLAGAVHIFWVGRKVKE